MGWTTLFFAISIDIFEILKNQSIGYADEIQLTDSINVQALNNKVETVQLIGKRFDCGHVEGYVNAINYVLLTHKF